MLKSKRKIIPLIGLVSILFFTFGLFAADTIKETKWVGYLTHGVKNNHFDKGINPQLNEYSPKVDSDIVIGLRKDGVVVWKKRSEFADEPQYDSL